MRLSVSEELLWFIQFAMSQSAVSYLCGLQHPRQIMLAFGWKGSTTSVRPTSDVGKHEVPFRVLGADFVSSGCQHSYSAQSLGLSPRWSYNFIIECTQSQIHVKGNMTGKLDIGRSVHHFCNIYRVFHDFRA